MQHDILTLSEKYHPHIGLCVEMLINAVEMDEAEFFYSQLMGKARFMLLKDTNWINNDREVIKFENKFYIKK